MCFNVLYYKFQFPEFFLKRITPHTEVDVTLDGCFHFTTIYEKVRGMCGKFRSTSYIFSSLDFEAFNEYMYHPVLSEQLDLPCKYRKPIPTPT